MRVTCTFKTLRKDSDMLKCSKILWYSQFCFEKSSKNIFVVVDTINLLLNQMHCSPTIWTHSENHTLIYKCHLVMLYLMSKPTTNTTILYVASIIFIKIRTLMQRPINARPVNACTCTLHM